MPTPLEEIEKQLAEARKKTTALTEKVKTEGITSDTGEVLLEPTINAGDVNDTGDVPEVNYSGPPGNVQKTFDKLPKATGDMMTFYQKQYEDWQKEKEEMTKALQKEEGVDTKEGDSPWKSMINWFKKRPSIDTESKMKIEMEEYKVPEWLEKTQQQSVKVAELKGEMNKLDIERQTEIDRIYTGSPPGMAMRYRQGQIGEVNRSFDSRKAYMAAEVYAEAALMQAYQGNLTEAHNMVNDVVNAYTFDQQQKRADFDALFQIYGSWIDNLDQDQKKILEDSRQEAIRQEEDAKKEKYQVMEWAIQYPNSGITVDDTLEEALKKASAAEAAKPMEEPEYAPPPVVREWEEAGGETGTGMTKAQWIMARTGVGGDVEALQTYLASISTYTTREEALADLADRKRLLISVVGPDGYEELITEVDRIFPSKEPGPKIKTDPQRKKEAEEAGKTIWIDKDGKVHLIATDEYGPMSAGFFTDIFAK